MKIYIKYMVSMRCKLLVQSCLDAMGLHYSAIELGEVNVREELTDAQRKTIHTTLLRSGLELMDDQRAVLIEKIKQVVIEFVHYSEEPLKVNFSEHLADVLNKPYNVLSHMFSEVTGLTIEQYIIANRIERVKELLLYDEMNLTEIADHLNYSSVAHLSNQFKKITGLTPTYFKELKQHRMRLALETLADGEEPSKELKKQTTAEAVKEAIKDAIHDPENQILV